MPLYTLHLAVPQGGSQDPVVVEADTGERELSLGDQLRVLGEVWEVIEPNGLGFVCAIALPVGSLQAGGDPVPLYKPDIEELTVALRRLHPDDPDSARHAREALAQTLTAGDRAVAIDDEALSEITWAIHGISLAAGDLPPSLKKIRSQIDSYFDDQGNPGAHPPSPLA